MKRKLIITQDRSHTFFVPDINEHYHSVFGAIQESKHIFIQYGFNQIKKQRFRIFEVGLGTGLNCFLSWLETQRQKKSVYYQGIELYPVEYQEIIQLNYPELLDKNQRTVFEKIHKSAWEKTQYISENFMLKKIKDDIITYRFNQFFDLIYFDAFAPNVQPELWTETIFKKIFKTMKNNALLLTYSSKGIVKRALRNSGFTVIRLEGPIGKKHIICAKKH